MDLKLLLVASLLVARGVNADNLKMLEAQRAQVLTRLTEVLEQLVVSEKAEAHVESHANLDIAAAHPRSEVAAPHPRSEVAAPHPRLEVAAPHPRSEVAAPHPRSEVAAPHPRSEVAAPHPRSEVAAASSIVADIESETVEASRAAILDHLTMSLNELRSEEHADESDAAQQDVADSDVAHLQAQRAQVLSNMQETLKQLLVVENADRVDAALASNEEFTDGELTALLKATDYNDEASNVASSVGQASETTVASTPIYRVKDLEDGGKYWSATTAAPALTNAAANVAVDDEIIFHVKDLEDGGKYWSATGTVAPPTTEPNTATPIPAPAANSASLEAAAMAEFYLNHAKSNSASRVKDAPTNRATFVNMLAEAILQRMRSSDMGADHKPAGDEVAQPQSHADTSAGRDMEVMDADSMQQALNVAETQDEATQREQEHTAADDLLADLTW